MAIDKAVDSTQLDADLTSVADAIRDKAGIGSLVKLSFPEEFVQSIGSIPLPTGEWVITLTRNSQTGAWEPDRNFTEVYDAYATGKTVAIRVAPSEAQYCSAGAFFHSSGYFQSSYLDYWVYEWKVDPVTSGQFVSYKFYTFRWNGITPSPEELIYYTTDADADPSEVVSGAIFYNASGKQTGTYIPVDVIPLSAAQNGVYSAPSGQAYSPVTVSVPNSYSAADEGKVVHNAALTPQTAHAKVVQNGTIDTTLNNSVEIDVPSSSPTLITKNITSNGTYSASSDNADGYSQVTVNVSGGGGGSENEDGIIMRTISGAYENSRVTEIGPYVFYRCSSLTTASFPACTDIGVYAFSRCIGLTTASFSACTTIGSYAFYSCSGLTTVSFPVCATIRDSAFTYCSGLTTVSFPACKTIGAQAFKSCYRLISLYLMGSSVATLGTSTFQSTPIGGYSASAGQYGSVFVPQSLLASYQAATNWASIASRIVGV